MIVATAGHVDHGKTLLVKSLTGVDTDRLPEEKKRGLTIELGFAYHDLGDGGLTGFVDVPGHEKFIRTMLAGVSGIDYVIFVVAADDGPMPQTAEHLAIMDLLDVKQGIVVLTKIDRVEPQRVDEVAKEIRSLIAGTTLANVEVLPVSAMTGEGIDTLREDLAHAAASMPERDVSGNFRLAIDRSFLLDGAGRVVTGTVFSGSTAVGEELMLSGSRAAVRVRGIHAQNAESESAHAGQRCALNIVGGDLRRTEIHRGDWVVAEPACFTVTRFDAEVRVLKGEAKPMRNRTPVHVHVGAADVTGRVVTFDGNDIAPGDSALVQIQLSKPLAMVRGDRMVLRDQSALRTVGGGVVLDPLPVSRGRSREMRRAYVTAMTVSDPISALTRVTEKMDTVRLDHFAKAWNFTESELARFRDGLNLHVVEDKQGLVGLTDSRWGEILAGIKRGLRSYHDQHPDKVGVNESELRLSLEERVPVPIYDAAITSLLEAREIIRDESVMRLPEHAAATSSEEQALWQKLSTLLSADPMKPPVVHDLSKDTGKPYGELNKFLMKAARDGRLVRVSDKRFFMPDAVRALIQIVEDLVAASPEGVFTVREYRDRAGIGRNSVIEILEYFDRVSYTLRTDQTRRIRKPAKDAFGNLIGTT